MEHQYELHFMEEDTEAGREVTCPKLHSQQEMD